MKILFSNNMRGVCFFSWIALFTLTCITHAGVVAPKTASSHVLAVTQKIQSSFAIVQNYTCEVENTYYSNGVIDEVYRLMFYYRKGGRYRMDFIHPHKGTSIFYTEGDDEFSVRPFKSIAFFVFRVSVDSFLFKSPSGQRVDQTSIEHFVLFLVRNLTFVQQEEIDVHEENTTIQFRLRALDYIEGKHPEHYRIVISKENWLPVRFERYNADNIPLEITVFKKYVLNGSFDDGFFEP
jgi:outer membrane lipoprotein-sorting protein